jgi:hypothetical protein
VDEAARACAAGKFQVSLDEEFPLGRCVQLLYSAVAGIQCVESRIFALEGFHHELNCGSLVIGKSYVLSDYG